MKALHYHNVALKPSRSYIRSRSNVDTTAKLGKFTFDLPVVPANMKCIISDDIVAKLQSHDKNYFHIMHRFDIDTRAYVLEHLKDPFLSISVGVKDTDKQLIKWLQLQQISPDFITIDIAHGHSALMFDMLQLITDQLPESFIIAGNISTPRAAENLFKSGAHAIKLGTGPGFACTTFLKTGFGTPMFTCVQEINRARNTDFPDCVLIADGGVRCNGDIAKALAAGADWVMAGSIFGACYDSPAETITTPTGIKKAYFGSASEHNKGHSRHVEGTLKELDMTGMTYLEKFEEIKQDLQSAISYAGGNKVSDLQLCDYWEI